MSKASRIAFHVYLVLTLFGMTVAVLYFLLMRNDFLAENPDIEPFFKPYIGAAVMSAIGALALLKDKRWGFWVLAAGLAVAFCIEIMAGVPWGRMIRIPVAAGVLFLLARWNKAV
ncbi:MAG: hypothetical protein ACKVUS_02240 [Saprospiraceae bacterium]